VLPILIGGLIILGALLVRFSGAGGAVVSLSDMELSELGITVQPYDVGTGIDRTEALELARKDWSPNDAGVRLDPFLFRVSAPARDRSADQMQDRPVWIVRYTGLNVHSPGGVPMSRAYSYFDAESGEYLGTRLLR
jgi:hypothetical protein